MIDQVVVKLRELKRISDIAFATSGGCIVELIELKNRIEVIEQRLKRLEDLIEDLMKKG